MKRLVILNLLFLFISKSLFSQEIVDTIIRLPEFYKGYGVIFSENYIPPVNMDDIIGRYTPSISEIRIAEEVLCENFNNLFMTNPQYINFTPINNVKRHFKHWNRQYLAYIEKNGDKIIWIQLLNFSNKREEREGFTDWKKEFIFGFGDFYEENTRIHGVNLTKKILFF